MFSDFMSDDLNNVIKEKDGNVYRGLLDIILKSGTGDSIKKIIRRIPKFNVKRMEIEEIEKVFKVITKSVVNKLYQTDCGDYSLRQLLRDGENSFMTQTTATNNIAYGVIASAAPYLLGALAYYFDESFIFFYIRDSIVEPNYREMVKEIREVYEKPTEEDELINKTKEFSSTLNSVLQSMLIDATSNSTLHLQTNMVKLRELVKDLPKSMIQGVLDMDVNYPVPMFFNRILMGELDNYEDGLKEFFIALRTTFSKDGLREIYNKYGKIQTYGKEFDILLNKLYEDRRLTNGLSHTIDGLELTELKVLHKLLSFQSLDTSETTMVNKNTILKKISTCLKGFSSIGTICIVSNDKLIVRYEGKEQEFYYLSDNIVRDKTSPFNIFGRDRDMMERIYNSEPYKFCGNQTVLSKIDRQNMVMDGKTKIFRDVNSKMNHRRTKLNQLLASRAIRNNPTILEEINTLRSGNFTKLKYVKQNWFEPPVIDDPITAALTLAEMEGINNIVSRGVIENAETI